MIYFIRRPDSGRIKIGTTIRLRERLRKLSRVTRCDLEVLGILDGDRDVERMLHILFDELRVAGEWFEPGEKLLDHIATDCRQWDSFNEGPLLSPVRLDLATEDHDRLAKHAKRYGLSKSSYVRMALFERMEADEGGKEGR